MATPIDLSAQNVELNQGLTPSFGLTISTAKGPVKAGSTVQIEIVVRNISGHDISFQMTYTRPFVEITDHVRIADRNGVNVSETDFGRKALGYVATSGVDGKLVHVSLKMDKSFAYQLNVDELYDMRRPGKYTIQIDRFDEESKTTVKSNKITVTIAP